MKGLKVGAWLAAAMGVVSLSVAVSAQSYVPHRVFNSAAGTFEDFESMAAALAAPPGARSRIEGTSSVEYAKEGDSSSPDLVQAD